MKVLLLSIMFFIITVNPVFSMDGGTTNEKVEENGVQREKVTEINKNEVLKSLGYYRNDSQDQSIRDRNALIRFQSDHNLSVDASYGPQSQAVLTARANGSDLIYRDVIDQPPTQGKWITINKTLRILTLYEGDQVVKKYPVAQGKEPSLTPEGKFWIVNRVVNPAWGGAGIAQPVAGGSPNNPLGYRWMGINHGGGGTYGIHGNNSPRSIGTNASLGCVRMINYDVEELFEIIAVQTPVWIGTDAKLKEWGVNQESYLKYVQELELAGEKAREEEAKKQAELEKAKEEEAKKQAELEELKRIQEEERKKMLEFQEAYYKEEYLEYLNWYLFFIHNIWR